MDRTGDLYKTFTGLQPYWNYSIQMAAKTVELGNYSEPIFVMTGEEGKHHLLLSFYSFKFDAYFGVPETTCVWRFQLVSP